MKREVRTVEVHIAVGLPGSGKTTWMKQESEKMKHSPEDDSMYRNEMKHEVWYIDMDHLMGDADHKRQVTQAGKLSLKKLLGYSACLGSALGLPDPIYIYIDGLALCQEDVMVYLRGLSDLVDPLKQQYIGGAYPYRWNIVVDQWKEDRDQCLINASLREGRKYTDISIKNAKYEIINEDELLKEIYVEELHINDCKVVYHDVPKVADWQIALDRHGDPERCKYMDTESWSLGGDWCNYLGSHGYVEPDNPIENTLLDDLLEKIAPSITYLQYKKLVKECVTYMTRKEHDYYGGSVDYAWWRTDLDKLYKTLHEMKVKIRPLKKKA